MKLAVSNIAWPKELDAEVAGMLRQCGVTGIEVAPTKVWSALAGVTREQIDDYRKSWLDRGFEIIAAQSLLFGRPELSLFGTGDALDHTLDYLLTVMKVCARLGAKALVFGSPKNRLRGELPEDEALDIAAGAFGELAYYAAELGTCLVLEANPPEYGADFVTHAVTAIELVTEVNHPGFRLHLDTACMTLAGDPIGETFEIGFPLLRHFHVSEPNLALPGTSGRVDHAAFAAELDTRGYDHWVSLEMRQPEPFTLDGLAEAVRRVKQDYDAR